MFLAPLASLTSQKLFVIVRQIPLSTAGGSVEQTTRRTWDPPRGSGQYATPAPEAPTSIFYQRRIRSSRIPGAATNSTTALQVVGVSRLLGRWSPPPTTPFHAANAGARPSCQASVASEAGHGPSASRPVGVQVGAIGSADKNGGVENPTDERRGPISANPSTRYEASSRTIHVASHDPTAVLAPGIDSAKVRYAAFCLMSEMLKDRRAGGRQPAHWRFAL